MAKGIIYLMSTAVPGLIKIGKTTMANYSQRMYNLESNGYRNVSSLKRAFAIEVEGYDEKELLLHTIFEKSRVADTELFAIDANVVIQLLSSFEGTVVFPASETKQEIFEAATENITCGIIPDGVYYFARKKKSDNKLVKATGRVINGCWTLLKGSSLGIHEDIGTSNKSRKLRTQLPMDANGVLLDDFSLGDCSPSCAGSVVLNQSCDGWIEWKNAAGKTIDIYRKSALGTEAD